MAFEIVEERIHLESVFRSYNRVKKAPTSAVNKDKLKTEVCKIVPILNFPIPAKRKQFRTFLGQINWLALFITNLAQIKVPLTDLIRKTVRWSWEGGRQQKAVDTLCFLLRQTSVLGPPDLRSTLYFTLRYLIETPQPIKTQILSNRPDIV